MRVFHGSDVLIQKVELDKGETHRDFGQGFYVTNIHKHAHLRALDTAKRHGTKPIVTEFEFHELFPKDFGMQFKQFTDTDKEWVEFVIMNRNADIPQPAHNYDIIEGPIANDRMTRQIERYKQGKISMNTLIEKLTYREPTHQICFCTFKSLYALESIENKEAKFAIEDISDSITEALISDYGFNESIAMEKLFESSVYEKLTNTDTEFYKKSWQYIYEILKKEIESN